jgi:hypothetical protein
MIFRNLQKNPQTMIRIGMLCLLISLIWPRFVHLSFNLGPDLIDAVHGFLLGISISMNLWAVGLKCRQQPCGDC